MSVSDLRTVIPCTFRVPGLGAFAGFLVADGSGRALFPREIGDRIMLAWCRRAMQPDEGDCTASYCPEHDEYYFRDPATRELYRWPAERIGEATLYPIGEGAWTWCLD